MTGYNIELQNCLREAEDVVRTENAKHRAVIDYYVSAGLFVLVQTAPYHCRSTDAVAGELVTFVKSFTTRAEAEEELAAIYGDQRLGRYADIDFDEGYHIEPELPMEDYVDQTPIDPNEVPF